MDIINIDRLERVVGGPPVVSYGAIAQERETQGSSKIREVESLTMFLPNPGGAFRVAKDIKGRLAESLGEMAKAVSKAGMLSHKALTMGQALQYLPVAPPDYFARYFEILQAVDAGDVSTSVALMEDMSREIERGAGQPGRLRDRRMPAGSLEVFSWADLEPGRRARYARPFARGGKESLDLVEPAGEEVVRLRSDVAASLELLDVYLPDLADEIRTLLSEIVLCSPADVDGDFAGASTFYIWGAVFLNPAACSRRLDVVEVLVTESTHALLYGLAQGGSLLRDRAVPTSLPSGHDEPLDRSFHAAVVSARLQWALRHLAGKNALSGEELSSARERADRSLRRFVEADAALGDEGRFVDAGRAMLRETRRLTSVSASRAA
ncbi:aKG-HExxH-type peptide beta-hydroxylase [Jiella sonneratiae]|uniref:HEXXH motif domain-containing protein n=1 Tax=Jiella sonneratiae TaxID=2816856 RepID=A0ABS3J6E2_9HYPH|nr:HEXXH motif-containing putative peptide modification protein [Jiella sonneratiae]MBO0905248.1 hypothetical protein [Jiella sonneratiae]